MNARKCPVCDWEIKDAGIEVGAGGKKLLVCCEDCAKQVQADPAKYGESDR